MEDFFGSINKEVAAAVAASFSSFLIPRVRRAARDAARGLLRGALDYAQGPLLMRRILGVLEKQGERIAVMDKQLQPNGGSSMVDSLGRLEAGMKQQDEKLEEQKKVLDRLEGHRRQTFIMQPRPALELDGYGNALLVSAALGRLMKADAASLCGMTWQGFLDGARVEDFQDAFRRVAATAISSEFRGFEVEIYARADGPRESRGLWEIRAVPIGHGRGDDALYSATLHPVDEDAREVATRNHWLN